MKKLKYNAAGIQLFIDCKKPVIFWEANTAQHDEFVIIVKRLGWLNYV
jgi:hypothetical protein